MTTVYSDAFYDMHLRQSLDSARVVLAYLFSFWKPASIVDVGCGRGTWLQAAHELGCERLTGLDGHWNSAEKMVLPNILFQPADLNLSLDLSGDQFELAMSLEVAEHLSPQYSENFVETLSSAADAVLFSAAYTGQPGDDHINTRPHSFWAELFLNRGYFVFDIFRPKFWGDSAVMPWYQQNTFLYVRKSHPLFACVTAKNLVCSESTNFLDCIHPWVYECALAEIRACRLALANTQLKHVMVLS
jgi:SAM-dependent methyltransferase